MPAENREPRIVIQTVLIEETVDEEIEPLPMSFSCDDSSTLKKWFLHFCGTENPKTSIVEYKFLFLETEKCYLIKLKSATNHYSGQSTKKPTNKSNPDFNYYAISKKEYTGLREKEVLDKIESQLQGLVETTEFALSLLSKAKQLAITFNDRHPVKLR